MLMTIFCIYTNAPTGLVFVIRMRSMSGVEGIRVGFEMKLAYHGLVSARFPDRGCASPLIQLNGFKELYLHKSNW